MTERTASGAGQLSPVAVQILLSLGRGPRHGYGIKLDIEQRTEGAMSLGSGTLYQGLQRLEERGWIREARADEDADARRGRHYELTEAGRSALGIEIAYLRRTLRQATDLLPALK